MRTSTTDFEWGKDEIDLELRTLPDLAGAGACHYRQTLTCEGGIREDPGDSCATLLQRTQGDPSIPDFLKLQESCYGFPTRILDTGKPKEEYRENWSVDLKINRSRPLTN